MSKTYRLDFSKGINVVGDKAILPDGFATILDNVDLRSGCMRPIGAPEYQFAAPAGTTRSWSYRGRWFHSANWQDHTGHVVGGIERVYTTEEGKYPTQTISGVTTLLGTPRPKTILGVARSADLSPGGLSVAVNYDNTGNLQNGVRVYRISAKTADGILPPCAPVSVTIDLTTHVGTTASTTLTWGAVPKAIGYIIWEGPESGQLRLDEVPASSLTYTDTGAKTASGDSASDFLQEQEFQYAYTYQRNVKGVFDESGLSGLSIPVSAATGRYITRDFLNDGYWDQKQSDGVTAAVKIASAASIAATSATSYPPISLTSVAVTHDDLTGYTKFAKASHGFVTGDKVKFLGFTDPAWLNLVAEVVKIDANNFAIPSTTLPTDGATLPAGRTVQLVKCIVGYTSTSVVVTDDIVYIAGSGTGQTVAGHYKATRINDTSFSIQLLAEQTAGSITLTTMKWIPLNGYYWKWIIYRNEQGIWNEVVQLDLDEVTYTDAKPYASLGGTPSSLYEENGILIDYNIPPLGLMGIEQHYGMLFAIVGHTVRWTPVLQPNAWPDVDSVTLPYKPVALASFGQGLIILCEDAIYRLDGNTQTGMSLSKTHAEDGCFAPHTVCKTDRGLIYLAKRGVMVFDGSVANCITDTRVKGSCLTAPSRLTTAYPFWWMPTVMTRNYSDLAGEDSIKGEIYSYTLDNTFTIEGYNGNIKAFYFDGKYYLFYTGADYQANTAFCVDMQIPGLPITTLGMKILDAHVNELEQAFILCDNVNLSGILANFNGFVAAESTLTAFAPTNLSGIAIYRFGGQTRTRIPLHGRSGSQAFSEPIERKRFTQIEFHGTGTLKCRIYVDKIFIMTSSVTLTETPSKDRRIGIPIGTRGYTLDIEFCGDADVRAIEYEVKPMSSTS